MESHNVRIHLPRDCKVRRGVSQLALDDVIYLATTSASTGPKKIVYVTEAAVMPNILDLR